MAENKTLLVVDGHSAAFRGSRYFPVIKRASYRALSFPLDH